MENFNNLESVEKLFNTVELALQMNEGLKFQVEISKEGVSLGSNDKNMTPSKASSLMMAFSVASLDAALEQDDETLDAQWGKGIVEFLDGFLNVVEDLQDAGEFHPTTSVDSKMESLLDDFLKMSPSELERITKDLKDKYGI